MAVRPRPPLRLIRRLRDGTPVYDLGATVMLIGGTRKVTDRERWYNE